MLKWIASSLSPLCYNLHFHQVTYIKTSLLYYLYYIISSLIAVYISHLSSFNRVSLWVSTDVDIFTISELMLFKVSVSTWIKASGVIFQNAEHQNVNFFLFISNTTSIWSVLDRLKYESKKSRSAGNSTGKYGWIRLLL